MAVNYAKRTLVPMWGKASMKPEFDLIVYGVEAHELMTVPNPIVAALAAKYPDHQSTLWDIRTL
jgi:hypothetical protein